MIAVAGVGLALGEGLAMVRMARWSRHCRQQSAAHAFEVRLRTARLKQGETLLEQQGRPDFLIARMTPFFARLRSERDYHAGMQVKWERAASRPWAPPSPQSPAAALIDLTAREGWRIPSL